MIDKLVLQFETCPEQKTLKNEEKISCLVTRKMKKARFWMFFDTQINILSPINF